MKYCTGTSNEIRTRIEVGGLHLHPASDQLLRHRRSRRQRLCMNRELSHDVPLTLTVVLRRPLRNGLPLQRTNTVQGFRTNRVFACVPVSRPTRDMLTEQKTGLNRSLR